MNTKNIYMKIIFFLTGLVILWCFFTKLFSFKYGDDLTESQRYDGSDSEFYTLEENSIDVLFLGSSKAAACFNPLVMWNEAGITGFNKGIAFQSYGLSYYQLLDFIRIQSPRVVVLEVGSYDYPGLIFTEFQSRVNIDNLQWSEVKLEAVNDVTGNDEQQNFFDYLFPLLRYHERWSDLNEEDFKELFMKKNFFLRGFSPQNEFAPIYYDYFASSAEKCEIPEENIQWIAKIADECKKNGMALLLVKTPEVKWTHEYHDVFSDIAEELGLDFLDLSEVTDEQLRSDMIFADTVHLNLYGANWYSVFLAQWIKARYEIDTEYSAKVEEVWNKDYANYIELFREQNALADFRTSMDLVEQRDIFYSDLDYRYVFVIACVGNYSQYVDDETRNELIQLGISDEVIEKECDFAISFYDDMTEAYQYWDEPIQDQFVFYHGLGGHDVYIQLDYSGSELENVSVNLCDKDKVYEVDKLQEGINLILYDRENDCIKYNFTLQ